MHALAQVLLHSGAHAHTRAVFHDVYHERDAPPAALWPSTSTAAAAAAQQQQQQQQRGCLFVLCCRAATSSPLLRAGAVDDIALTLSPRHGDGAATVLLSPTRSPLPAQQQQQQRPQDDYASSLLRTETSVFGASHNNSFCSNDVDSHHHHHRHPAASTTSSMAATRQQQQRHDTHTTPVTTTTTTVVAAAAAAAQRLAQQQQEQQQHCCFVVWASYTYIQQHLPQHFPCVRPVHEPRLHTTCAAATRATTTRKEQDDLCAAPSRDRALVLLRGCHLLSIAVTTQPSTSSLSSTDACQAHDSDHDGYRDRRRHDLVAATRMQRGRRRGGVTRTRPLTRVQVRSMLVDTSDSDHDNNSNNKDNSSRPVAAAACDALTVVQHTFVFAHGGAVRFVEALKAIRPALAQHVHCVVSLSHDTSDERSGSGSCSSDDNDARDNDNHIDDDDTRRLATTTTHVGASVVSMTAAPRCLRVTTAVTAAHDGMHAAVSPPSSTTTTLQRARDDDNATTTTTVDAASLRHRGDDARQTRRRAHAHVQSLWGRVKSSVAAVHVAKTAVLRTLFDDDESGDDDDDDDKATPAVVDATATHDGSSHSHDSSSSRSSGRATTLLPILPPVSSSTSATATPPPLTAAEWARCFVDDNAAGGDAATDGDAAQVRHRDKQRSASAATTTTAADTVVATLDDDEAVMTGNAVEGVSLRARDATTSSKDNNNNNNSSNTPSATVTAAQAVAARLHRRHVSSSSLHRRAVVDAARLSHAREIAFRGGIDADVRLEVWCYLLDVHSAASCVTTTRASSDHDNDNNDNNKNNDDDTNGASAMTCCAHCAHKALYVTLRTQWQSLLPIQEAHWAGYVERKRAVDKDVRRTNRGHAALRDDASRSMRTLRSVLMAYVMYNFDHGYWQGMSDVAAVLVVLCCHANAQSDGRNNNNNNNNNDDGDDDDDDECASLAFALFRQLLSRHMASCFSADVQHGMPRRLRQVGVLVRHFCPVLYAHLQRLHAHDMMLCFRWLLALFTRDCATLDEVARLWDVVLSCPYTRHYDVFVAAALLRAFSPHIRAHLHSVTALLRFANNLPAGGVCVRDVVAHTHAFYDEVCAEYTLIVDALAGAVTHNNNSSNNSNNSNYLPSMTRVTTTVAAADARPLRLRRPTLEEVVELLLIVDGDLPPT